MSGQRAIASQRTGKNLMAVRTQQMGVDPRAKTACSHLPELYRTREYSKNGRTDNNQGRSTMRNVFNKLGRGADMRDRLNKM